MRSAVAMPGSGLEQRRAPVGPVYDLPPVVASALSDSAYRLSPWSAADALRTLDAKAMRPDLKRLAAETRRALAPCPTGWLGKRLTLMGMAHGYERDPVRAEAWLHETARLLRDLPQDILAYSIDEALKGASRGFMPAVGQIRAIADPLRAARERDALRLEAIVALIERPPLPPPPEPEHNQSASVLPAGDVDQANADMRHLGLRTRYRPDGTAYQLADGEEDPAAPAGDVEGTKAA